MWLLSFLPESSGIICKRCKLDSPTSGLFVGDTECALCPGAPPHRTPPPLPSCGPGSGDSVHDHSYKARRLLGSPRFVLTLKKWLHGTLLLFTIYPGG